MAGCDEKEQTSPTRPPELVIMSASPTKLLGHERRLALVIVNAVKNQLPACTAKGSYS